MKTKIKMDIKALMETANEMMEGLDRQECEQVAMELEALLHMVKLRISDSREAGNLSPFQPPLLFRGQWWN